MEEKTEDELMQEYNKEERDEYGYTKEDYAAIAEKANIIEKEVMTIPENDTQAEEGNYKPTEEEIRAESVDAIYGENGLYKQQLEKENGKE